MKHVATSKARVVSRNLKAKGWKRRRNYPTGVLVAGRVHAVDGKVVMLYEDRSFLVRDKFGGNR